MVYDFNNKKAVHNSTAALKVLLFFLTLRPIVPVGRKNSDQGFLSQVGYFNGLIILVCILYETDIQLLFCHLYIQG